ncbi:LLM class flavin-dependent oxidoreductase [Kitasatospora sp. NPDC058965]|uniref:LLM class flavin-dependent oxidoreductase n=1 Tax=Kitasatospora sp. NPDC058965 TaxID=3346682 RepID=UPI00368CDE57
MQLGISLAPPRWPAAGGAMALQTALRAEQLGLHWVTMSDHVLPTTGSGLEPLTLLAAVAGATSRIRLASSVLVLPYRHPLLVAGQAATLDVLSGGRFALGVGTGGDEREFAALGLDVHDRGRRTDAYLAALRELWSDDAPEPPAARPRTPGGPPVWVGGRSEAALRRALRFGTGWHGSGVDEQDVRTVRERLATLGEELDRDPAELTLSAVCTLVPPGYRPAVPLPLRPLAEPGAGTAQLVDALGRLGAAGLSMVSLWLPLDPHQLLDALGWVHTDLLGGLTG